MSAPRDFAILNSHGVPDLFLPKFDKRFGYSVAYSAPTNTPPVDMLEQVVAATGDASKRRDAASLLMKKCVSGSLPGVEAHE